jgi:hypothetical protein
MLVCEEVKIVILEPMENEFKEAKKQHRENCEMDTSPDNIDLDSSFEVCFVMNFELIVSLMWIQTRISIVYRTMA